MFIIYLLEVKKSHKRRKTERRAEILEKPVATGEPAASSRIQFKVKLASVHSQRGNATSLL